MSGDFLQPREARLAESLGEMQHTVNQLRAERDAARAALGRVRELHRMVSNGTISGIPIEPRCAHCGYGTRSKALTEAGDSDD